MDLGLIKMCTFAPTDVIRRLTFNSTSILVVQVSNLKRTEVVRDQAIVFLLAEIVF